MLNSKAVWGRSLLLGWVGWENLVLGTVTLTVLSRDLRQIVK